MPQHDHPLTTPIYLKTRWDMTRPPDRVAYLMAGNGLYIARRHPWFGESCVPARSWPPELEDQVPYFSPSFPLIPRSLIERLVGFFDQITVRHGSEAIALLLWDRTRGRYRTIIPRQVAAVGLTRSNRPFPIGVEYHLPTDLPEDWVVVGDVHSHGDAAAWSSSLDRADEAHSPGLHVIIGRIDQEPPDISVTAVIDGHRFELPWPAAISGYQSRRWRVPRSWIDTVRTRVVYSARDNVIPSAPPKSSPTEHAVHPTSCDQPSGQTRGQAAPLESQRDPSHDQAIG